jgi:hypothetical protein
MVGAVRKFNQSVDEGRKLVGRESDYRRRIRESGRQAVEAIERKREAAEQIRRANVASSYLERITKELERQGERQAKTERTEWRWKLGEILSLLAAAIVGVWAIWSGSYDASQQRAEMQFEHRPWVGSPIDISEAIDQFEDLELTLTFVNVGSSPTQGMLETARIIDSAPNDEEVDWSAEIKKICAAEKSSYEPNAINVIPGEKLVINFSDINDNAQSVSMSVDQLAEMSEPRIVGCIVYGEEAADKIHQTGFTALIPTPIKGGDITATYAVDAD